MERVFLALGLSMGVWLFTAQTEAHQVQFKLRSLTWQGQTYRYRVYLPLNWSPDRKWPVILFLHGAGERGADSVKQTEVGIGPAISRTPARFPVLVVMPQCRRGLWWDDPAMEAQALQALEESIEEFNGDRNRLYLTGLSMGGYGTFYLATKHPDLFAALIPICGGVVPPPRSSARGPFSDLDDPYREAARRIGPKPIWIFHGAADPAVPVTESRKMAAALRREGVSVKYTEYPGLGHNSWDRAYAEPELLTWLFSCHK